MSSGKSKKNWNTHTQQEIITRNIFSKLIPNITIFVSYFCHCLLLHLLHSASIFYFTRLHRPFSLTFLHFVHCYLTRALCMPLFLIPIVYLILFWTISTNDIWVLSIIIDRSGMKCICNGNYYGTVVRAIATNDFFFSFKLDQFTESN